MRSQVSEFVYIVSWEKRKDYCNLSCRQQKPLIMTKLSVKIDLHLMSIQHQ